MQKIKKYILPILLIAIVVIFFIPALNDNFLSDDYDHLMFARSVDNIEMIPGIFKIPGDIYRPVMNVSIAIDYLIWNYHPFGFHLTNLLLLILSSLLIYYIVKKISRNNLLAFFAALIFAIFPSHHETITWISGRTDLLASFFYLLAIYLFIKFIFTTRYKWLILSYLSAIPAFFSKEISITLPFVLIAIYLFYLKKESKIKIKKAILLWLPYLVLLIIYFIIRKQIVGAWIGGYSLFGQSSSIQFSPKSILLPFYFVKYLINWDFLAQFWQKLSSNKVINIISLVNIAIFIICIIYLNIEQLKNKKFWKNVIFLGILTYFISIPNLSILPSLKTNLMNTRVLYIATIPLAILISYLIFNNLNNKRKLKIAFAIIICLALTTAYIINYIPWHQASAKAGNMLNNIEQLHPDFEDISYATYKKEIFFKNLPDNIYGAFVFRNGFAEALRIKFKNKNLFVNPLEKIVWIVKNNKGPITSLCNFKKNKQTTGIQVFKWDNSEEKFIEQNKIAENYNNRQQLQDKYASQIKKFNSQQWKLKDKEIAQLTPSTETTTMPPTENYTYQFTSKGKSDALKSPQLNLPPVIFDEFIFNTEFDQTTIADFMWPTKDQKFSDLDNNILVPVKTGDNSNIIDLTKCPAWFLEENIEQLQLIPTEKAGEIKINKIELK